MGTCGNVDFKHALQALRPGQRRGGRCTVDWQFSGDRFCRVRSLLARRIGRTGDNGFPERRVGSKDAVVGESLKSEELRLAPGYSKERLLD